MCSISEAYGYSTALSFLEKAILKLSSNHVCFLSSSCLGSERRLEVFFKAKFSLRTEPALREWRGRLRVLTIIGVNVSSISYKLPFASVIEPLFSIIVRFFSVGVAFSLPF